MQNGWRPVEEEGGGHLETPQKERRRRPLLDSMNELYATQMSHDMLRQRTYCE